jgi:hypothetical protein
MLPLWIPRIRRELHIALPIETRNRINPILHLSPSPGGKEEADRAPLCRNRGEFISACRLLNLERSVSENAAALYADEIVSCACTLQRGEIRSSRVSVSFPPSHRCRDILDIRPMNVCRVSYTFYVPASPNLRRSRRMCAGVALLRQDLNVYLDIYSVASDN